MRYDFVEIGTSNFDTLIEHASDLTIGLSIEPIKHYLEGLPNKPNVKKLNCAVSPNNRREILQVFYVPESTIVEHNLPLWLKGCNSVGDYHFQHHALGIVDLVKKQHIPCYPIGDIFKENNVTELELLKVDTEGADCEIMMALHEFLENETVMSRPRRIVFESNELSNAEKVQLVKTKFVSLGYSVVSEGSDTVLVFNGNPIA